MARRPLDPKTTPRRFESMGRPRTPVDRWRAIVEAGSTISRVRPLPGYGRYVFPNARYPHPGTVR